MTYPIENYFEQTSPLIFGCMGLGGDWQSKDYGSAEIRQAHQAIDSAVDGGIKVFDHADIYRMGKSERVFAEVLKQRPELGEQISIQSKCGIRVDDQHGPKRYDFSPTWIKQSVENILTRLEVEQLDALLLHRPDPLMEPEQVAQVFNQLTQEGKVKHFGVSNMTASQMMLLQAELDAPLIANQLELSLSHLTWLEEGITAGCAGLPGDNYSTGIVEYCRLHKVQLQAWGSLSQGIFTGVSTDGQAEHVKQTAELVAKLAFEYGTSPEAIVLAWLMRHPAKIQPIIGTVNPTRIAACCQATTVELTREHWYAIYVSARGQRLP